MLNFHFISVKIHCFARFKVISLVTYYSMLNLVEINKEANHRLKYFVHNRVIQLLFVFAAFVSVAMENNQSNY